MLPFPTGKVQNISFLMYVNVTILIDLRYDEVSSRTSCRLRQKDNIKTLISSRFQEVAYYSGASNQLKTVGDLHWVGGKPPTDLPICGYDKSKCPVSINFQFFQKYVSFLTQGYPLHVYLLMGSFLLILVLVCLFVFFWRRYKLEQELAAMSWKIRWEELDGEDSQKKEKKKTKKRKPHDGYFPEADPLLRSTSRSSVNSDKVS